jgi:hypothetical protein
MRRSRLVQVIGGTLMAAALLLPSSALAASAPTADAGAAAPAATTVAAFKLECKLVYQNPLGPAAARRVNICTWNDPAGVSVKTYRLWRVVDAPNKSSRRMLVAVAAAEPHRYVDAAIRSGHRYTYYATGIGEDGKRVALSNRVTIKIGRSVEKIRMACALTTVSDASAVACHWGKATRATASRYVLIRSVDGAARERLYNVWLRGKRSFVDTDVKPAQTIRYAVLVLSSGGRVVGRGGPVAVTIPVPTPAPSPAAE